MKTFIISAILVLGGSGVSLAAQNSLPGDTLYPVKTDVNERVAGALKLSTQSRAEYEAKLAGLRLKEAVLLASHQEISAQSQAVIKSNFEEFDLKVNEKIEELRSEGDLKGAIEVASRFEIALRAHERILARFEVEGLEEAGRVEPILVFVRSAINNVVETRVDLETSVIAGGNDAEISSAAESKISFAEKEITNARNFLDKKKLRISSESDLEARARLSSANELLSEARVRMEAGSSAEAFIFASHAGRIAEEARVFTAVDNELIEVPIGRFNDTATTNETEGYDPEEMEDEASDDQGSSSGENMEVDAESNLEIDVESSVLRSNGNGQISFQVEI